MRNYFVVGGAGFVGSHLVREILEEADARVTIYDSFTSGRIWHLDEVKDNSSLEIIEGDVKDDKNLCRAMSGADVVYHLASNPDIARAVTEPDIDFWEGTYLTNNVLEAMRTNGVKALVHTSGSGVYGDTGTLEVDEDYSPMRPISTYGASKLACEAMICSYCFMFDMGAASLRFANVVGPHQTHGVGYDFVRKLMKDPSELEILGDGEQSKSYIYVSDVVSAMRLLERNLPGRGFLCYNVATLDYLKVVEIADIVTETMGLQGVRYNFTGGDRGWKGDVPIVRFNTERIRELGWSNRYNSKEAITLSVKSIYEDALADRFGWQQEAK
jgi:UDP-glucose 4-epimerase